MSCISDIGNPKRGLQQIEWAHQCMPVLQTIQQRHRPRQPFAGHRIAMCLHITKETAVLVRMLMDLGATVAITNGNPQTTQDDVAHALVADGAWVFGWRGMTEDEVECGVRSAAEAFDNPPSLVLDDGGHLISRLHTDHPTWVPDILGSVEKTTAGVQRLRAMVDAHELALPVFAVNDVATKWEFDNTYGVGQSTTDGIIRACGLLLAGRTFVVVGFGHVGRGVALRARGHGARVVVTCRSARTALCAALEGFTVLPLEDAVSRADFICTATGEPNVLRGEHLDQTKDGAVLCNSGWSNIEINLEDLNERTNSIERVREHTDVHTLRDGSHLLLLSEGGMVNLDAGEGNPSEVMDLSYSNVVLSLIQIVDASGRLTPGVHTPSDAQDQEVAALKLASLSIQLDGECDPSTPL